MENRGWHSELHCQTCELVEPTEADRRAAINPDISVERRDAELFRIIQLQ